MPKHPSRTRTTLPQHRHDSNIEPLEARIAPALLVGVTNNTLTITSDSAGDAVTLATDSVDATLVRVTDLGGFNSTYAKSSFTSVTYEDGAGNDALTVDYTNGDPLSGAAPKTLTWNAHGGTDVDQFLFNGSNGNPSSGSATLILSASAANSGTIIDGNGTLNISNVTAGFEMLNLATLNLQTQAGQDDFSVSNDPSAGLLIVMGTTGGPAAYPQYVKFKGVTSFTLDLGVNDVAAAADKLTVYAIGAFGLGLQNLTFNTGNGDDAIFTNIGEFDLPIGGGSITTDGGTGNDTFTMNARGGFTLDNAHLTLIDDSVMNFSSLENFAFGGYTDQFTYNGSGAESVIWTPSAVASLWGTIAITGGPISNVSFQGALTVTKVASFALQTAFFSADDFTLDAGAPGFLTLAGTVSNGSFNGSFIHVGSFSQVASVTVDLGIHDSFQNPDALTINSTASKSLQNLTVKTGDGADTVVLGANISSLALPLQGGAFTIDEQTGDLDTLLINGSGVTLDMTSASTPVKGIEVIDLTGSGQNMLALDLAAVQSSANHDLRVFRDPADRVLMVQGGWNQGLNEFVNGRAFSIYTQADATLHVQIPAVLDLSLTQSDFASSVLPSDTITYTLNYANDGVIPAKGVKITETLPAGTSFNAAANPGWSQVDSSNHYTYDLQTLNPGATGTVNFVVRVVEPVAAGLNTIDNTSTIADDGSQIVDATPADNTATDSDTLNAAPSLLVFTTAADGLVPRGGTVAWTVSFINVGVQTATGVMLIETLPENTTFDAAASSAGWSTLDGTTYTFDAGSLPGRAWYDGSSFTTVTFATHLNEVLPIGTKTVTNTVAIQDDLANGTYGVSGGETSTFSKTIYQGIYALVTGHRDGRTGRPVPATIRVMDVATGTEAFTISSFAGNFGKNGLSIAVGDVNGDGFDDIVAASRTGGNKVRAFDGVTGAQLTIGGQMQLTLPHISSTDGVLIALGDFNGDGRDDLVVGESVHGRKVTVFDGVTATRLASFAPFGGFTGGLQVAAGDVNGDGRDDLIVGQASGGSQVKVFSGDALDTAGPRSTPLLEFKAGGTKGVFISTAYVQEPGGRMHADIVTGTGAGMTGVVKVFSGLTGDMFSEVQPFGGKFANGVRVAATDLNLDGIADIIVSAGPGGHGAVEIYDGDTGQLVDDFTAFPAFPNSGVKIAASSRVPFVQGGIV